MMPLATIASIIKPSRKRTFFESCRKAAVPILTPIFMICLLSFFPRYGQSQQRIHKDRGPAVKSGLRENSETFEP